MRALAWINRGGPDGFWGDPAALALPMDARGVLLADGVFETVLVLQGQPQLLEAHLQRWQRSADLLHLGRTPAVQTVQSLVTEAIARSGITNGALRLNWCRGSAARGLQPVRGDLDPGTALFWLQLSPWQPRFAPVRVIVSPTERRQATSLLSQCKSFGYGSALIARLQAERAGADDALLISSSGGLCCGSSANLLVWSHGGWQTPPLSSGCLAGIMRQQALELGLAHESPLDEDALSPNRSALLLNSLGCQPIHSVMGRNSDGWTALAAAEDRQASRQAEVLWHRLLDREAASAATPAGA